VEVEVEVYKVIVVGTDGSERAGRAVDEALALASMTGAVLRGVHVMRPVLTMGTEVDALALAESQTNRHDESDRISAEFLAAARERGVAAEIDTFDGDPADALISVAEATGADLMVVGNRGMAGLRRFVLGSVPNKVAHRSPCSLLIVDTDRSVDTDRGVGVAWTDGS
jgi:nucleotide-binding universal stress UspA family protein